MKAEIVSIGTELLLGHILNTNARFLAQKLAGLGIDLYYETTVGDNPERLSQTIRKALGRSDVVITTGGLGPTVDDITNETIARLRPESLRKIHNKVGTAPGLIAEYYGKVIVCLPGPPRELHPMFENDIIPYLMKRHGTKWLIKSRIIKTTGLPESRVDIMLKDLLKLKPPTTVGIYAKMQEVDLHIMAKAKNTKEARNNIGKIEKRICSRLKNNIFGFDDDTLEGSVAKILTKKKKTLSVAESCTGGFLSHRLTNISGSSDWFFGGIIAYSNKVKVDMLGVSPKALKKYGAVSGRVALEMARGVKALVGTDIGISITGIAGPKGGSAKKSVGLVYIAIVIGKKSLVKEFKFTGLREEIKFKSSQVALDLLRRNLTLNPNRHLTGLPLTP